MLAGLRAIPGAREELAAAALLAKSVDRGYPTDRLHRLLPKAAGLSVSAMTAEERSVEAEQRSVGRSDAGIPFMIGIMLDAADELDQRTERMRQAAARSRRSR